MKIYVVIYTGGDYLGYYETNVLGCYLSKDDAIRCKEEGVEDRWSNSEIIIEECEVE